MVRISTNETASGRPAFYAGRFFDRVRYLPGEHDVLSDWDVLPARLPAALARTSTLAVLDLFSFPFESIKGDLDDVPLILVLPPGFDAEFLTTVFGAPAFKRLGFFDRVATGDDALWGKLRQRYGWAEGQRLPIGDDRPEAAAEELGALLEAESAAPALGGARRDLRYENAVHRVQAAALEPQFVAARGNDAESVPFDVLEVGTEVGRWAAGFDLAVTRFTGVDASEGMIEAARANFPGARFDVLGKDLTLPYGDESFDLTFSVDLMHRNPTPAKRVLLAEMWRVTRPGGRLMLLEEFVTDKGPAVYPMPVMAFVELLLEATAGQVVLEHMESLQYPGDHLVRGGLLSLSRLGVPRTW